MKIVADENIPFLTDFFAEFGEITALPGRSLSHIQVQDADVLLVRSVTQVTPALLKGSRVKFVGTCTIGTDHLDMAYLNDHGIAYASAPGCNAGGVVQYVLSALASLDVGCFQKSIGIIGAGNVGGRLCRTLRAMGVEIKAYDPFLTKADNPVLTDLGEVLACDAVCMHTPYSRTGSFPTHHLLNRSNLPLLKPGAILLNAGRGGVIDNQALKDHLQAGADLRVVLDVWESEPAIDLALLDQVAFGTPHIAGYSFEGKIQGSAMIFAALAKHLGLPGAEINQTTHRILHQAFGEPSDMHCHDVIEAVLASYRVRYDDLRMRAALKAAKVPAQEFDALRKGYPERREFGHFRVHTKNPELLRTVHRMGFAQ